MVKCPFCGFENEDGALFCEQCKSDLSAVPTGSAAAPPHAASIPVAAVVDEKAPMAAVVESQKPGEIPPGEIPMAAVVERAPAGDVILPEPLPGMAPPLTPAEAAQFAAPPAGAAAAPAAPTGASVPSGASPKLEVIRGQKVKMEFQIYADQNFIGRADEKPVDIDLEDQEPPDRTWCSRQHAVIHYDEAQGIIMIEDLNSANGTFVNRTRVYSGQKRQLFVNDVIQIGTVHLKLKV
ncbi:MAG: FHA domain-containing protein [Planctomycetes bacterium]|nr:FHA domain-containing protein [Planctomycetota bacterium]MBI3760527.1 FHA domain-containing protein [Chloroflexota bacterium]